MTIQHNQPKSDQSEKKKRADISGLAIPAGLFVGMGVAVSSSTNSWLVSLSA